MLTEDHDVSEWLDRRLARETDPIIHRNAMAEEFLKEHSSWTIKSRQGVRRAITVYMKKRNARRISGPSSSRNQVWCMVID